MNIYALLMYIIHKYLHFFSFYTCIIYAYDVYYVM